MLDVFAQYGQQLKNAEHIWGYRRIPNLNPKSKYTSSKPQGEINPSPDPCSETHQTTKLYIYYRALLVRIGFRHYLGPCSICSILKMAKDSNFGQETARAAKATRPRIGPRGLGAARLFLVGRGSTVLVQDTVAFDVFLFFVWSEGSRRLFSLTYEQLSQGFKFMEEDTCEGPQDYVEGFPIAVLGALL